jgi:hypothetical protein
VSGRTSRIVVHGCESERGAWELAVAGLNRLLAGSGAFDLVWAATRAEAVADAAGVVGLSLLPELWTDAAWDRVEASWRAMAAQCEAAGGVVFVTTILRHLPADKAERMARLRRLNLLAARLSQQYGILVIDLDRTLSHVGALALRTDARLDGELGQRAAARTMLTALLNYGVAGLADDAVLDVAIAAHEAEGVDAPGGLTLPPELVRFERRKVAGRTQVFATSRPAFDDRGLQGLLRDLRTGRIGASGFVRELGRKVVARMPGRRA